MTIKYLAQKDFPFGNNIHFVYSLNSREFLHVHPSLEWITSNGSGNNASAALSKVQQEDLAYLSEIFHNLIESRFNGKVTFKLAEGEGLRWFQITPFLGNYLEEPVISGSVTDITDEILNIQSIKKFTDKKNSILHMLGHDLRGPLNIAKSLMTSISRDIKEPVMLEKTAHIAVILQQSIDMISDLVKREFLEMINAELVKKRIDIVKQLRDYLEECKRSEMLSGISISLTSSSDKIFIKLDDAKFVQVINNLISNSLKFTPSGGAIHVAIEERPEQVDIRFSDNGIGIPEVFLPEIFEKFTAARRPGLQGEPTLGLGLSIVKTIIGWHEGKISCESKEGIGTTFFISLPKNLPEETS